MCTNKNTFTHTILMEEFIRTLAPSFIILAKPTLGTARAILQEVGRLNPEVLNGFQLATRGWDSIRRCAERKTGTGCAFEQK